MATRREFLAAIPAVVATGPAVVATAPQLATPTTLRDVFRKRADGGWDQVRMFQLVPGDVFRLESAPLSPHEDRADGIEMVATERPQRQPDGIWSINGRPVSGDWPT